MAVVFGIFRAETSAARACAASRPWPGASILMAMPASSQTLSSAFWQQRASLARPKPCFQPAKAILQAASAVFQIEERELVGSAGSAASTRCNRPADGAAGLRAAEGGRAAGSAPVVNFSHQLLERRALRGGVLDQGPIRLPRRAEGGGAKGMSAAVIGRV